jgi:hypothetical protein
MSNRINLPHFGAYGFDGNLAHGFLQHALMFIVAFVVEEYVLFDPVNAALLFAEGVVFKAEFISHLVKEFYLGGSILAWRNRIYMV